MTGSETGRPEQTAEPGEAATTDEGPVIAGPFEKGAEHYLEPSDWHGLPVPAGRIGPWGLGSTCWYYRVEVYGDRLFVAAETATTALIAAAEVLVAAAEERGAAKERERIAAAIEAEPRFRQDEDQAFRVAAHIARRSS